MVNSKQALIEWIRGEDGGRAKPPSGIGLPPYSTLVRFVDGGVTWPAQEAWSLAVTKRGELGSEYRWLAEIHFLFQDAPHDYLREGRTFELYEGHKCVARGKILVQQDNSVLAGMNNIHAQ